MDPTFTPQELLAARKEKRVTMEMRVFLANQLASAIEGFKHALPLTYMPASAMAAVFDNLVGAHISEFGIEETQRVLASLYVELPDRIKKELADCTLRLFA